MCLTAKFKFAMSVSSVEEKTAEDVKKGMTALNSAPSVQNQWEIRLQINL